MGDGSWCYAYKRNGKTIRTAFSRMNVFDSVDKDEIAELLRAASFEKGKWYRVHKVDENRRSATLWQGILW